MRSAVERGEEHARRAGHRFNLIVRALPQDPSSGMTVDELLARLKRIGYREDFDQLGTDLAVLLERGEISSSLADGRAVYWVLPKGLFEARKRVALIKLHNAEISEEDLQALEEIARRGKVPP
ncbi:MAG: hypothetical protein NO516_06305 [Candidatus Methanomethylicia archaeon]|nr:hypothetical protein [Candidatus Methanomethylicia archaeon]